MARNIKSVVKEFISMFRNFIKDLKDLTVEELAVIIFCIGILSLFVIGISCAVKETFFKSEAKYSIRDVNGVTYRVDVYTKESDGTIKIECDGNGYILNGYTITILNDEKE